MVEIALWSAGFGDAGQVRAALAGMRARMAASVAAPGPVMAEPVEVVRRKRGRAEVAEKVARVRELIDLELLTAGAACDRVGLPLSTYLRNAGPTRAVRPAVAAKVQEVKVLVRNGTAKNVSEACRRVGIALGTYIYHEGPIFRKWRLSR